jgi:dTDP-4-amino-4,6-dideoxygalactose transaminase
MKNLSLFKVVINSQEAANSIKSVIDSGFVNEGIQVTQFQNALRENMKVNNLVVMNSCTSALTVAYKLAGVGPNTEVITSPMTCVATNTPIVNLGGKVVWADIDPATGNIDPSCIEQLITNRTRAIAYVDWAGNPAELEKIQDIGKKNGIKVIQDAAHAYGATWKSKSIAHFADFTCFSFQAIKHLSSGDGGALVCLDDNDFSLAKKLKWFGYDREATKDEHGEWKGQRWSADITEEQVGYKFNMNNVSAAIGLSSIKNIDKVLKRHRENAKIYDEEFCNDSEFRALAVPPDSESSYWAYTALISEEFADLRDLFIEEMNKVGIGVGLIHLPNDIYSAFSNSKRNLPGVRDFERRQVSFPCGSWIEAAEVRQIARMSKKVLKKMRASGN